MSRTILFSGKSGTRYQFQVFPLGTTLKAVGGVYIVTKRTFEDRTFTTKATHEPVMIAHADDFSAPLFSQAQLKAFAECGAEHLCVCAVKDADERLRIERDLIDAHEQSSVFRRRLLVEPRTSPGKPVRPNESTESDALLAADAPPRTT